MNRELEKDINHFKNRVAFEIPIYDTKQFQNILKALSNQVDVGEVKRIVNKIAYETFTTKEEFEYENITPATYNDMLDLFGELNQLLTQPTKSLDTMRDEIIEGLINVIKTKFSKLTKDKLMYVNGTKIGERYTRNWELKNLLEDIELEITSYFMKS